MVLNISLLISWTIQFIVLGGMNGSIVYELDRPENMGLEKSLKASSSSILSFSFYFCRPFSIDMWHSSMLTHCSILFFFPSNLRCFFGFNNIQYFQPFHNVQSANSRVGVLFSDSGESKSSSGCSTARCFCPKEP